jgi:hypothetical protein
MLIRGGVRLIIICVLLMSMMIIPSRIVMLSMIGHVEKNELRAAAEEGFACCFLTSAILVPLKSILISELIRILGNMSEENSLNTIDEEHKHVIVSPSSPLSNRSMPNNPIYRVVLTGGPCGGKCWAAGTKLLLANGQIINVENVQERDELLGDDSSIRSVNENSLYSDVDELYRITFPPNSGQNDFIVNQQHILVIKYSSPPTIAQCNQTNYSVQHHHLNLAKNSIEILTRSFPSLQAAQSYANQLDSQGFIWFVKQSTYYCNNVSHATPLINM